MDSINKMWNDYHNSRTYKVLECTFKLTKKDMLSAMMNEFIVVDGVKYKVPEEQLLECLKMKFEGSVKLTLEELED